MAGGEGGPAESAAARTEPASPAAELTLDSAELEFGAARPLDLPALDRYGPYELLGRLAYGGMAEIFLARERSSHGGARLLVVKRVLPHVAQEPPFVEMFTDEARLAMQLSHPHICHVYAYGEAGGTSYLAMEWVNGEPLSKIFRRTKELGEPLPVDWVLKVTSHVAAALDYAHRATDAAGRPLGIVHRDVSPQNIMVGFQGSVKLLDFGIAKAASHSAVTGEGVIKGKFAYMSPEQCTGDGVDGRSDIFSLGVCLFEALAGTNPFKRPSEFETMARIVSEAMPELKRGRGDVPNSVIAILERALSKDPAERYARAGEMQVALEEALAERTAVMPPHRIGAYLTARFRDRAARGPRLEPGLRMQPDPSQDDVPTRLDSRRAMDAGRGQKRRWPLAVAALALLAVGAGAAAFALSDGPEPEVMTSAAVAAVEVPAVEAPPVELPAVTEPAATGSLAITSVPPGARVLVNGEPLPSPTPTTLDDRALGPVALRLELEGHAPWERTIDVRAGEAQPVDAELTERAPTRRAPPTPRPPGQLSVNTRPWSKVYLGRRLLGTTPIGSAEVPSGSHRLRFIDGRGRVHQRRVRVRAGAHERVSFALE